MVEYSKVNVKSSGMQLKNRKAAVKNNAATTLRMSSKMFDGNHLPHELLLTTKQRTKLRNAFDNNMSTDMKLSEVQISKIIQRERFLGSLLSSSISENSSSLGKKYLSFIRNSSCCFNI